MYLGVKLHKTRLHNGLCACAMISVNYVQEAVRNCAVHSATNYGGRFRLPKKTENPFKFGLDISPELDPGTASYYLTNISIAR